MLGGAHGFSFSPARGVKQDWHGAEERKAPSLLGAEVWGGKKLAYEQRRLDKTVPSRVSSLQWACCRSGHGQK